MAPMNPEELFEDDLELEGEAEDWDEETLGLDLEDSDTLSLAREVELVQWSFTIAPRMKISVPGVHTFIVVRPPARNCASTEIGQS